MRCQNRFELYRAESKDRGHKVGLRKNIKCWLAAKTESQEIKLDTEFTPVKYTQCCEKLEHTYPVFLASTRQAINNPTGNNLKTSRRKKKWNEMQRRLYRISIRFDDEERIRTDSKKKRLFSISLKMDRCNN